MWNNSRALRALDFLLICNKENTISYNQAALNITTYNSYYCLAHSAPWQNYDLLYNTEASEHFRQSPS